MKKLIVSLGILSTTAALTGCGVATTTYSPAYTTTSYRVAYPVNTVRTYPLVRRVGYYPVNYNYYPVNYWNTGYYYPYRYGYGTRVYYGGSRVFSSSWWGL